MRSPVRPYGFDWLEGKLVVDPKEYRIVQKMILMRTQGQGVRAIARFPKILGIEVIGLFRIKWRKVTFIFFEVSDDF